ncbi:unnamed protein product [Schistocephalus solidus]|uniref:Secreted protein n=1 Tax=Schistocephalus solidus TaxID=70667 RepID=A0A183TLG9_SCHSO|nr:unnamed protein product [Schistocephalus solidus]
MSPRVLLTVLLCFLACEKQLATVIEQVKQSRDTIEALSPGHLALVKETNIKEKNNELFHFRLNGWSSHISCCFVTLPPLESYSQLQAQTTDIRKLLFQVICISKASGKIDWFSFLVVGNQGIFSGHRQKAKDASLFRCTPA